MLYYETINDLKAFQEEGLYLWAKRNASKSNVIKGIEISNSDFLGMPYWAVRKMLPDAVNTMNALEVCKILLMNDRGMLNLYIRGINKYEDIDSEILLMESEDVYKVYWWVADMVTNVANMESENLSGGLGQKISKKGADELDKLGVFAIVDDLAEGKVSEYMVIKLTPYETIYGKLMKTKIDRNIIESMKK